MTAATKMRGMARTYPLPVFAVVSLILVDQGALIGTWARRPEDVGRAVIG